MKLIQKQYFSKEIPSYTTNTIVENLNNIEYVVDFIIDHNSVSCAFSKIPVRNRGQVVSLLMDLIYRFNNALNISLKDMIKKQVLFNNKKAILLEVDGHTDVRRARIFFNNKEKWVSLKDIKRYVKIPIFKKKLIESIYITDNYLYINMINKIKVFIIRKLNMSAIKVQSLFRKYKRRTNYLMYLKKSKYY
tara:strand:+ start:9560 stop:10132 length:573 start_codon:yes stop_codon:yes gene_type:complete